jgi:hypothetical protein
MWPIYRLIDHFVGAGEEEKGMVRPSDQ